MGVGTFFFFSVGACVFGGALYLEHDAVGTGSRDILPPNRAKPRNGGRWRFQVDTLPSSASGGRYALIKFPHVRQ